MLTVLGTNRRACDGVSRRQLLQAGAVGLFGGMTLPNLLQAEGNLRGLPRESRLDHAMRHGWVQPGKAKSVIMLYLFGGPSHQDMFDMKPAAPIEYRGEFDPASTSVPGIQICELLPGFAKWMHRSALIRSANHQGGDHNALPSLSGYNGFSTSGNNDFAGENDPPCMGSICEYLGMGASELAAYAYLPAFLGWGRNFRRAGPHAGFIGKQFDPIYTTCRPRTSEPAHRDTPQIVWGTPALPSAIPQITLDRLQVRRSLLSQLDRRLAAIDGSPGLVVHDKQHAQAFNLLTSPTCRAAFDLDREDPRLRARYGGSLFGESVLMARRLVETGVRFVQATWDLYWRTESSVAAHQELDADYTSWDTHTVDFAHLRRVNLPVLDQVYSALMEDLDSRGLLDETLVVVMGEMGRMPKINASAGRDHWTNCYSVLLSGAGVQGGAVYGASDRIAAFPASDPVKPADICATIYRCLGIDPQMPIFAPPGDRPIPIAHGGVPIEAILA